MDWSVQQVDAFCGQLDRLADQLSASANSSVGLQPRDEQLVNEVVQTIQRVGEGIAWAYGQHHGHNRQSLGELFAQPFVDHRTRDRLKQLLETPSQQSQQQPHAAALQQRARNKIATQILQTIHILLQATPADSTLFCNLTAGWYLNGVVAAKFEFRENEDLLPLWMTVVKEIASMLTKENMMLFFDPTSDKPFPIYSEAVKFYHHPTAQVRTGAQAVSLEIFLKLRDEDAWVEPIFQLVLSDSKSFFTHLCCLLREFWYMVDGNIRSGSKRDTRSALSMQNDILVYVHDVLSCEIPQLSAILKEKLMRFAVLPILVRSALRVWPSGGADAGGAPNGALSSSAAMYLLCDLLITLKGSSVLSAVALTVLSPRIPEEILQMVLAGPPRTPMQYMELSKQWGGHAASSAKLEAAKGPAASDEALYAMPELDVVTLLGGRRATRGLVQNRLLDLLDAELQYFADPRTVIDPTLVTRSVGLLEAVGLMWRALRGSRDPVGSADRLGQALCGIIAAYKRLPWSMVDAALGALQEVAHVASALGPHAARALLGAPLRDLVLRPIAAELLNEIRKLPGTGGPQELLLWEFQDQWRKHLQGTQEPNAEAQKQAFLESAGGGADSLLRGGPDKRPRAFRVLLSTYKAWLTLSDPAPAESQDMPGIDEIEAEESNRYQPGVAAHIGKMNRVKCQVRNSSSKSGSTPSELDAVYLLPAQSTLVLVRPDEQKPFYAVPVISEPLRTIRLELADENIGPPGQGANSDEAMRNVGLQVIAPRSPVLRKLGLGSTAYPSRPGVPGGDRLAMTTMAGFAAGYPGRVDSLAHSAPVGHAMLGGYGGVIGAAGGEDPSTQPLPISLVFADERRRRVACKLLAQAQVGVHQRATKHMVAFLSKINAI